MRWWWEEVVVEKGGGGKRWWWEKVGRKSGERMVGMVRRNGEEMVKRNGIRRERGRK